MLARISPENSAICGLMQSKSSSQPPRLRWAKWPSRAHPIGKVRGLIWAEKDEGSFAAGGAPLVDVNPTVRREVFQRDDLAVRFVSQRADLIEIGEREIRHLAVEDDVVRAGRCGRHFHLGQRLPGQVPKAF